MPQAAILTDPPPKLEPPGAGIPLIQRLMVRLWYGPRVARNLPLHEIRKRYEIVTAKLIDHVSAISPLDRRAKVLVDPIQGLEDSSRFWSLNEVMEHVVIVSRGLENIILDLAAGKRPEGKVETANLKPQQKEGRPDDLTSFKEYAPGLMARLDERIAAEGMNVESGLTFPHPWFGPFNAHQWYWMLGSHQGVHYKQSKAIISKLGRL